MNDWNESNFLEKMMPRFSQEPRALGDSCPDFESLCAFAESRAHGVVRDAIAAHLAECAECAELHSRLLSFASEPVSADDPEWRQAAKRLDNWAAAVFQPQRASANLGTAPRNMGRNWWLSPQLPWAITAVSTLALVISTAVFFKLERAERRPAPTISAQAQVKSSSQPRSGEPIPQAAPQPQSSFPAQGPLPNSVSDRGAIKPPNPVQKTAPHPSESTPPSQNATNGTRGNEPAASQPSEQQASSASAQGNSPDEAAQGSGLTSAQASPAVRDVSSSPARAGAQQHSAAYVPPPVQSSRPITNLPGSFQLEAGTRIWVRLSSLTREADGRLRFHGTLFEPVNIARSLLLDRGTAVEGFETISQGRTSLVLTDLVIQGVHYGLKSPAGKTVARPPGAGAAINFDANQIVETFLEAASVYEMRPGASR